MSEEVPYPLRNLQGRQPAPPPVIEQPGIVKPKALDVATFAQIASRGRWVPAPHLVLVNIFLMFAAYGKINRLMISMPPRHGKSLMVSQYFPAWYIGSRPDKRVILCSYEAEFAATWGGKARDILQDIGAKTWGGSIKIRQDSKAADHWDMEKYGGGMQTAGVEGGITGKGFDCLPAGTMVTTEEGDRLIEQLVEENYRGLVFSCAMQERAATLRRMIAGKKTECAALMQIKTQGGVLHCTPNHRIAAWRRADLARVAFDGFIAADKLRFDHLLLRRCPFCENSHHERILDMRMVEHRDKVVYDIEVERDHCFFANGFLVHNCGIIDDSIKGPAEAASPTVRRKTWEWYTGAFYNRQEPGASIVLMQTRWHQTDLPGQLLQEAANGGEQWVCINVPALSETKQVMADMTFPGELAHRCKILPNRVFASLLDFGGQLKQYIGERPKRAMLNAPPVNFKIVLHEDGPALWPGRFDEEALNRIKRVEGPYQWNALYQGRPTPEGGGKFKSDWFRYYKRSDEFYVLFDSRGASKVVRQDECQRFATMDVAGTKKEDANNPDYSVFQVWDVTPKYDMLLVEQWRDRTEIPEVAEAIVRISRNLDVPYACVERNGLGLGVVQTARRLGLPVRGVWAKGDKTARCQTLQIRMEAGTVFFPRERKWVDDNIIPELISYPHSATDDVMDAMAWAAIHVQSLGGPVKRAEDKEYLAARQMAAEEKAKKDEAEARKRFNEQVEEDVIWG